MKEGGYNTLQLSVARLPSSRKPCQTDSTIVSQDGHHGTPLLRVRRLGFSVSLNLDSEAEPSFAFAGRTAIKFRAYDPAGEGQRSKLTLRFLCSRSYYAVSSRFGSQASLTSLIDAAHKLGIRVILDVVHSHSCANDVESLNR